MYGYNVKITIRSSFDSKIELWEVLGFHMNTGLHLEAGKLINEQ